MVFHCPGLMVDLGPVQTASAEINEVRKNGEIAYAVPAAETAKKIFAEC